MSHRNLIRYAAAAATIALSLAACGDLQVDNPNEPDRDRVTSSPSDIEALVASTFRQWWPWVHDEAPVWIMATMADEFTSGFADYGILDMSSEPRVAWNNSTVYARRFSNQDPWYGLYAVLSSANDGLIALDNGLQIGTNGADNSRVRAFAKFAQGLALGSIAMTFDKAPIVDENTPDEELANPVFKPYAEVNAAAVTKLLEAAAIADTAVFTTPSVGWIPGVALTNTQLARLARSFAARYLAYVARTRTERAAVNWTQVLDLANRGITANFTAVGEDPVLVDDFGRVASRQRTTTPGDFARVDVWFVGPADSTEGFRNWVATPLLNRTPFQIRTKDRRIQGTTAAGSKGKYLGFHQASIWQAARGTYHWTWYYYHRFGAGEAWRQGPQPVLYLAEMDLLKAEALVRLNRAAEAIPLINKTRVANGELPPVDINGPPSEPGCVPRKLDGTCGSLWDALRWEKRIEGIGIDAMVAYLDGRGWQTLKQDTPVQLPIPGREIETLRLAQYTFGGPGGQSSAPAPDPERCPVQLPRCP